MNEEYLERIGSTWIIDSIYLFMISPIIFLAILFNSINLRVFTMIKQNKYSINKYYAIYSANSLIAAILTFSLMYTNSPRYFIEANYYLARIFRCKLAAIFINNFLLFGICLEIVVAIERISVLDKRYGFLKNRSVTFVSIVSYLIVALINMPSWFFDIKTDWQINERIKDPVKLKTFDLCELESFFQQIYGSYLLIFSTLIRNFLVFIIEIAINLIYVTKFKAFLNDKLHKGIDINTLIINRKKMRKCFKTYFFLSAMSIITNIVKVISTLTYLFLKGNILTYYFLMLYYIFQSLKHTSNFFVFYFYNSIFYTTLIEKTFFGRLMKYKS